MEPEGDTTEATGKYSYFWSLLLSIFFGPLGLLYSSILACILMLFAIHFDFSKLYFLVQQEPDIFETLKETDEYVAATGGFVFFWLACTPIGLIIVFFKNRKITNTRSETNND